MHISRYLHEVLLPFAKSSVSYLDNSLELTRLLSSITTTRNTYIITADIKSLYTNIPTGEGPQIVADEVSKSEKEAVTLKTLLSLVLGHNVFAFNGEYYRQTNGTAMGTIMAPSYANCYLRAKEERGLKKWLVPDHPNVRLYKRYIDDIGVVYDNHDNSLPSFVRSMREAYAPLELTFKIGRTAIVYLDTELTVNDSTCTIDHEMHKKPTSNKTYIPAESNHPTHMLNNLVYNDLLRVHRLCNTATAVKKHESIVTANALKQGYSRALVNKQLRRARKKASESTATTAAEKVEQQPATVTLTYNGKATRELVAGLHEYWERHASKNAKLLVAYRCNSNLKKLLVRSKAPFTTRPNAPTRQSHSQPPPSTAAANTVVDRHRPSTSNQPTLDLWLRGHQPARQNSSYSPPQPLKKSQSKHQLRPRTSTDPYSSQPL